jgi:nucleotide-binding universal stress UspA family protein
MFKHILVPTDGSRLAQRGVKAGVALARSLGARVTALHVMPPDAPAYDARKILAAAAAAARRAGVPCRTAVVTDPQPWGGILRVAHARKCDAIALASHGRGALGGLLLGSETQRVLAHAKVPVLVTR